MKPSDTITMAKVSRAVFSFYTDALASYAASDPESEDAEFANHAMNCAKSIAVRLGIKDVVAFQEECFAAESG